MDLFTQVIFAGWDKEQGCPLPACLCHFHKGTCKQLSCPPFSAGWESMWKWQWLLSCWLSQCNVKSVTSPEGCLKHNAYYNLHSLRICSLAIDWNWGGFLAGYFWMLQTWTWGSWEFIQKASMYENHWDSLIKFIFSSDISRSFNSIGTVWALETTFS